MAGWFRPRNLAIGVGLVGLVAFIPTPASPTTNVFETQGSKNIAARWSAGGGSDVHTPGAASPRGNSEKTAGNQDSATGMPTQHFADNQASQRPGEPGPFDKAWNKSHYGTEKGK